MKIFLLILAIPLLMGAGCTAIKNNDDSEKIKQLEEKIVKLESEKEIDKIDVEKEVKEGSNNLYLVTNVVDGDTFDVDIDGTIERIRVIGIDTPETKDPRKPVQCFGQEASDKTKELLLNQEVRLEADTTQDNRDKYSRLLRYIYREDGLFFNQWMIENGYAYEYTYNIPYKYQQEFQQAENQAREKELGLWNKDTCNGQIDLEIEEENNQEQNIEPVIPADNDFSCSVSKNCGDMVSCEEAYYYMNTCGKGSLDRDKDGIPCESICS